MNDEELFEQLARNTQPDNAAAPAPASLKARLYSALIREQQSTGPLASLSETEAQLCVFEQLVQIAPVGEQAKSLFYCKVCHARLLAESFDNPPIWWPGCPYSEFKKT